MWKFLIVGFFIISIVVFACKTPQKIVEKPIEATAITPIQPISNAKTDTFLKELLEANPVFFENILQNKDSLKVQIIYTQINRQANNNPVFKDFYYNVSDNYFYPASTVKMPTALLALQKLNEMKGSGIDKNTTMITEAAYSKQTPVYNDPTTPDGKPNIAQYVKKIFLVSDNDAFNRLYEFLGQEYINDQLHQKGYADAAILHRLDIAMTEAENRHNNPVNFLSNDGKPLLQLPLKESKLVYPLRNDSVGKAYYGGGNLISHPLDFSKKNRLYLTDLHEILKSVLFPNAVPAKQRFNLTAEDYKFVKQYMSQLPGETNYPSYDSTNYWDSYVKFLMYGSQPGKMPNHIRIFNKVGDAYGFLTDVAYVVDFENNIEFMLAATIYCNSDGVLNDDKYDYETIGLPFMKNLGNVIYNYELKRERKHKPDLKEFKMVYDK